MDKQPTRFQLTVTITREVEIDPNLYPGLSDDDVEGMLKVEQENLEMDPMLSVDTCDADWRFEVENVTKRN